MDNEVLNITTGNIHALTIPEYEICIKCMICNNFKPIEEPYREDVYVCDECRSAIEFAKELMKKSHECNG